VDPIAGPVAVRVIDCSGSMSLVVSYLIALIPFHGDAFIFVHSIFFKVSGVADGVLVVGHCIVRKCVWVEALVYISLMKKHFNFFWNRKNRALASNFFVVIFSW
jgi:hypothetical protein